MKRAVALGLGLVVAGGAVAPALAYHYDPVNKVWVIDCTEAPPYDDAKAKSGWQPFVGDDYKGRKYVGARTNDPYYVVYVDPNAKKVTVGAWQPWHDSAGPVPGYVQGPFFFDQSVSISPAAVEHCNRSVGWPPVRWDKVPGGQPKPPVPVPSRIPIPPPLPL